MPEPDLVMIDEEYWARFPDVLSRADIAQTLRKTQPTVYRWLNEGKIPAHNIAGSWIVYKEALQYALENVDAPYQLPHTFLDSYPEELDIVQQAQLVGMSRQTTYKWLGDGALKGRLFHGSWVIYKSEFIQVLRETLNEKSSS